MARVLVTRPEPGASKTAERLLRMGHEVATMPLFALHSVQWKPPGELFDAVMLTSANALRLAGPLPERYLAMPCYAVGGVTAEMARRHGFGSVICGHGDVDALTAIMAADGVITALHLAGREHRASSSDAPHIITRTVYAADPVDHLPPPMAERLAAGSIDRVLLYSARAAAAFATLADKAGLPRARLALGVLSGNVAEAAGAGWGEVAVASDPNENGLFAACDLLCDNGVDPDQRAEG